MNKIILIGHAEYDDYYVDYCKIIDAFLGIEKLKLLPVDLGKIVLISSTLLHGKPSAKIITDGLGIDENKIYLKRWLSNSRIIAQQIERFAANHPEIEVIIAITRTTEIQKALDYFRKNLKKGTWIGKQWCIIEDGETFLIDLEAKRIKEL